MKAFFARVGAAAVAVSVLGACGGSATTSFGVSRGTSGSELVVHVSPCFGKVHLIQVGGYVGGSRPPFAVPIFWEARSTRGSEQRAFEIGRPPPSMLETVRLTRIPETSDVQLALNGHGMSFQLSELAPDVILTGGYSSVPQQEFERTACPGRALSWVGALGATLLALGLGWVLVSLILWAAGRLAGRRRRDESTAEPDVHPAPRVRVRVAGSFVVALLLLVLWISVTRFHPGRAASQSAPRPEATIAPELIRDAIVIVSSEDEPDADGFTYVTFRAPAAYRIHAECDDVSIQVSELAEYPAGTFRGPRHVAICNPDLPLPGALEPPEGTAVTLAVWGSATKWRVAIVRA